MRIPLVRGINGIFFSKNYITIKEITVAITKGGIANFKSFSFLKYIIKNISNGPKSVRNLIKALFFITKC